GVLVRVVEAPPGPEPEAGESHGGVRGRSYRTPQQDDAPFQDPPPLDPEVIEVTDPTHPLYGRRFQVLSISHPPQRPGHVVVAYRGSLRLRIPVRPTEPTPATASRLCTRFTRDALPEPLALLTESPAACPDHRGPSGITAAMA